MKPVKRQSPQAKPRREPLREGDDRSRYEGLSRSARAIVAICAAVAVLAVAVHLSMVFLHVAPSNTLSKRYGAGIDDYVYPEFEQNWKLFAPDPLQQNIAVHARARISKYDGGMQTTGWINLSKADGEAIDHNLLPSHIQQNEIRRGWEFYRGAHDEKSRPIGLRGKLSKTYIKRIVMLRLGRERDGGTVERIQVRSVTTPVPPPSWSDEKKGAKPQYQTEPWWHIGSADLPGGWDK